MHGEVVVEAGRGEKTHTRNGKRDHNQLLVFENNQYSQDFHYIHCGQGFMCLHLIE
jgi:hypothetical protein